MVLRYNTAAQIDPCVPLLLGLSDEPCACCLQLQVF